MVAKSHAKSFQITGVDIEIRGWGGEQMANAGVNISKHYRELAFMGFVEVIKNLRTIKNNLNQCQRDCRVQALTPCSLH